MCFLSLQGVVAQTKQSEELYDIICKALNPTFNRSRDQCTVSLAPVQGSPNLYALVDASMQSKCHAPPNADGRGPDSKRPFTCSDLEEGQHGSSQVEVLEVFRQDPMKHLRLRWCLQYSPLKVLFLGPHGFLLPSFSS